MATEISSIRKDETILSIFTGLHVIIIDLPNAQLFSPGNYGKATFSRSVPIYKQIKSPDDFKFLVNTRNYLFYLNNLTDTWRDRVQQRKFTAEMSNKYSEMTSEQIKLAVEERSKSLSLQLKAEFKQPQVKGPVLLHKPKIISTPEPMKAISRAEVRSSIENLIDNTREKQKLSNSTYNLDENIHLTHEEAFYLAYEKKILNILRLNSEQKMSCQDLWGEFCKLQNNFPYYYVVYKHFKDEGWVVKRGTKFGIDFLIYKGSPEEVHSEYGVIIQLVNDLGSPKLSWIEMAQINRNLDSVLKSTLLVYVTSRIDASSNDWSDVFVDISNKFNVTKIVINRWKHDSNQDEL